MTDKQRSRRPIFIATLWAGTKYLVFRGQDTSGIALAPTKKFVARRSLRFITGRKPRWVRANVRERTEGARYRRRGIAEVAPNRIDKAV